MILAARVPESEAPSVEPAEDTMMAALFATSEIPPPPPREHAKRRRGRAEDEAQAQKKERREMEAARRASLAEAEAHQIRASQIEAGASSSRTVEQQEALLMVRLLLRTPLRVSRLQRTWVPRNWTHQLADRRRFAPQVRFTYHSSI